MKLVAIILLASAMLVSCGKQDKDFLGTDGTNIVNGAVRGKCPAQGYRPRRVDAPGTLYA